MFQETSLPTSGTSSGTEAQRTFKPGISAIREHRARQRADRILDQFAERFTEDNFFPEGGDALLFAMFTRLPQWPADTEISILDEEGDEIACYLKDDDEALVQHTITLVQNDSGTYSRVGSTMVYLEESLFWVLFSQIPSTSELSLDGFEAGVAALRAQVSALVRSERAQLFDALVADDHLSKSELNGRVPNPFLPFWISQPQDWSSTLWSLHMLDPQLPVERLKDLLHTVPLTSAEEHELLHDDALPATFNEALEVSRGEWSNNRAVDGLLHTRTHDAKTDALARVLAARLLNTLLNRNFVITEHGDGRYRPTGPDDNPVALVYGGEGIYGRGDQRVVKVQPAGTTTDSFYLAITSQLEPEELRSLGLRANDDVSGLRATLARLAIADNGGWFEARHSAGMISTVVPDWFKQLSDADRNQWRVALQAYSRAVLDAQKADLPDVEVYGEPTQLREYASEKLRDRLRIDHGLILEPDDVIVVTRHIEIIGAAVSPALNVGNVDVVPSTREHSLTDLSLSNIAFTNVNFRATAIAQNVEGELISALTASYLYDLISDLDVGENYATFLKSRLLTSSQGQLHAQSYAHVMQAQMRFDALEAKMAGDFLDEGISPPGQEDRGYKWVQAVLDQPVDNDQRARVEGHRIKVEHLQINGMPLDWLLVIGVASRSAVPPVVIYTPQAPDGKCFRELNNLEELRPILLDPAFQDYLLGLAPLEYRDKIKNALVNNWQTIIIDTRVRTDNFLEAAYTARVNRAIANVDQQTNTTWEKNWDSAWEIFKTVGEVGLMFTPFRIALPIAALRSVYAIAQGVNDVVNESKKNADIYFLEAALLLLDMIPFSKTPKIKPTKIRPAQIAPFIDRYTGVLNFDARPALPQLPAGLKLRSDGFFNGVHEKVSHGRSSFYLVRNGKAYPVAPDYKNKLWRMIDLNNPNASNKTPIFPDDRNVWRYHPPGGAGGGVYKLDLTGLEERKIFKKLDGHIADRLRKSIATIEADFRVDNGCHGFHPVEKIKSEIRPNVKEKLFTFHIPGMPNDKGKGAWRLKVREPADNKGVLVLEEIMPSHKSKY